MAGLGSAESVAALKKLAHDWLGAAGMVGLADISQRARELERACGPSRDTALARLLLVGLLGLMAAEHDGGS